MLESRPKDALVKLVKTVEIVETVETVETARTAHTTCTDHFHRIKYLFIMLHHT